MNTRCFLTKVRKLFKGDNYSRLCTSKIQDYYSPCIFMKIFVQKCHFWQCTTFLTTHPDEGLNHTLQKSQMTGESLYQKSMAKKWIKIRDNQQCLVFGGYPEEQQWQWRRHSGGTGEKRVPLHSRQRAVQRSVLCCSDDELPVPEAKLRWTISPLAINN